MQIPCDLDSQVPEKAIFKALRQHLGDALHELAQQKESKILEGHLQSDHVHVLISIPPKYSFSSVIGYIKDKRAIYIARNFRNRRRTCVGETFGHVVFMPQALGLMYVQSRATSRIRRKKIRV